MADKTTDVVVIDSKLIESAAKALPSRGDIYDEAMAIKVKSKPTYERGVWIKNVLKQLIEEIHASFDPICDSANRLHKLATGTRKKHLADPEKALDRIRRQLSDFDAEEERKRREKEAKARAEAERKAQEERDREAKELEESGATEEAEMLREMPVATPHVEVESRLADVEGVQYRKNWKGECVNIRLLIKAVAARKAPDNLLMVNQPELNKLAKALEKNMDIPGCRAWNDRVTV